MERFILKKNCWLGKNSPYRKPLNLEGRTSGG